MAASPGHAGCTPRATAAHCRWPSRQTIATSSLWGCRGLFGNRVRMPGRHEAASALHCGAPRTSRRRAERRQLSPQWPCRRTFAVMESSSPQRVRESIVHVTAAARSSSGVTGLGRGRSWRSSLCAARLRQGASTASSSLLVSTAQSGADPGSRIRCTYTAREKADAIIAAILRSCSTSSAASAAESAPAA
jgi:hypothetical protein